jgi:hypothetical protein
MLKTKELIEKVLLMIRTISRIKEIILNVFIIEKKKKERKECILRIEQQHSIENVKGKKLRNSFCVFPSERKNE